jgi:PHP family Zn ribbon phosphoesterase
MKQPKVGHWIDDAKTYYEELNKRGLRVDEYTPYFTDDIACSECLAKYSMLDNETQFFKHCPNCGSKND